MTDPATLAAADLLARPNEWLRRGQLRRLRQCFVVAGMLVLDVRHRRGFLDRLHVLLEAHSAMLAVPFGAMAEEVIGLYASRGDRLEERSTVVTDKPWKDDVYIHPREGRSPA